MRERPPPEQYNVIQDVQAEGTEVRNFQRDTTARLTLLEQATALSRCHQLDQDTRLDSMSKNVKVQITRSDKAQQAVYIGRTPRKLIPGM